MSGTAHESERSRRLQQNLQEVTQHLQQGETRPEPAPERAADDGTNLRKRLSGLGSVGLVLALVLGKLKWVLAGFKLLKFSSLITMVVSIWAYSLLWGWPFAVGFVLLIMVHEMGHGLVMRHLGIPAGAPTFIPFVGAVIAMRGRPRDAYQEALVAFGGPVVGSLAAVFCLAVFLLGGGEIWRALAFSGFFINLFNLLPVSPLDGGRIVGAFSRKMWIVGFAIGIPLAFYTQSALLSIILIIGGLGLLGRRHEPQGYFDIPAPTKRLIALAYFGLAGVLALAVTLSHTPAGS